MDPTFTRPVSTVDGEADPVLQSLPESEKLVEALVGLRAVSERAELLDWADARLRDVVDFSSVACLLAEPHGRTFRIRDVIASHELFHCLAGLEVADGATTESPETASTDPSNVTENNEIARASTALIDRWMRERRALQLPCATPSEIVADPQLAPLLECLDIGTISLHGVKEAFGGSATFFLIGARRSGEADPAMLHVLELIMPSLHIARQRIYRFERARGLRHSTIGLTAREVKVLSMIADGKTDEEAATQTGRSVHTIKNQMRHLVAKLGARNRTQAVLIAAQHGLLHPSED